MEKVVREQLPCIPPGSRWPPFFTSLNWRLDKLHNRAFDSDEGGNVEYEPEMTSRAGFCVQPGQKKKSLNKCVCLGASVCTDPSHHIRSSKCGHPFCQIESGVSGKFKQTMRFKIPQFIHTKVIIWVVIVPQRREVNQHAGLKTVNRWTAAEAAALGRCSSPVGRQGALLIALWEPGAEDARKHKVVPLKLIANTTRYVDKQMIIGDLGSNVSVMKPQI